MTATVRRFFHGTAIGLLTYCAPYDSESRQTKAGWVDPWRWVVDSYPRFKSMLAPLTAEDLAEAQHRRDFMDSCLLTPF